MSVNVGIRAEDLNAGSGKRREYGPYVGVVMNNYDSLYSGRLQVWIGSFGGSPDEPSSWHTVSYANPFYGISPYSATAVIAGRTSMSDARSGDRASMPGYSADDPNQNLVTTFGMWTQPPAVGTRVLVVFADGEADKGFWIAAIPEVAHGMIPANGAGASGQPEAEFDPADIQVQTTPDIRTVPRPPMASVTGTYAAQGLGNDPLRGIITSSSFRESPSQVMGFSTPKGHTFVMDDGDEGGASKLIRIRTKNGNQITLHDDTGMLYFVNAQGTSWMELGASGQVDVYGEAGISFATKGDINMHADGNLNMHSNAATKIVAGTGAKVQGTQELQLHGSKLYLEGVNSIEMHSCGELKITSFKDIFIKGFNFLVAQAKCFRWNSGTAKEAEQVPPEKNKEVSGYQTTVDRAPSREPYDQHDKGGPGSPASQADLPARGASNASGNTDEGGGLLDLAINAGVGYLTGGPVGAALAATGLDQAFNTASRVINVATRAEAIALARYADPGTIINYGDAGQAIRAGAQLFGNSTSLGGISASLASRISGNSITVPILSGFNLLRQATTQGISVGDLAAMAGGAVGSRITGGSTLGSVAGSIAARYLTDALTGNSARTATAEYGVRFADSGSTAKGWYGFAEDEPKGSYGFAEPTSMPTRPGQTFSGPIPTPPTRESTFTQPTRPGQQFSGAIPTPPTRPTDSVPPGAGPGSSYPSTSVTQKIPSAQTSGGSGDYLGKATSEPKGSGSSSYNAREGAGPTPSTGASSQERTNNYVGGGGPSPSNPPGKNADGSPANAATASQQLGGAEPATSIPAQRGGGDTGNFARGDNCGRPSGQGETIGAGMGANADPNAAKNLANIEALKNDPAWQAKLDEMKAEFPGLTDEAVYKLVSGESGFNWANVNSQSGATGGFQFIPSTAASLGYTTAQIQAMTPAEQLGVAQQYLRANNYQGGQALGPYWAAPKYANYPDNYEVYKVGTAAWQQNRGWRGPDDRITVGSIKAYYAKQ